MKKKLDKLQQTFARFILMSVCVLANNFNLILTCKVVVFLLY